jgi:DNA polymerase-4/protein ImuB
MPHFPLSCETQRHPELAGHDASIVFAEGSQKLILDYASELKGLQCGMPLQQALSMYGGMEILQADMQHYWDVYNHILDALELKSPLVEGLELGNIYIGIDGMQLIYTDDEMLARAVREVVPGVFEARIGIAEGKFAAYLAAVQSQSGNINILNGDISSLFEALSCDLLPVSLKIKEKLHQFGLHTMGQLAKVPMSHLQSQFGPEGGRIKQLARGRDDTPLYPRISEETFEESTTLASITVSLDLIIMALESLLTRAFIRLGQKGLGISRITLWTRSWISEHWEQDIRFKEPVMNTRAAITRIRQVIETLPQPGPVEQLGMKITGTGRPRGRQNSLISAVRAQEHLLDEIKQLEFRLGAPQLFQVKEVEPWSRIPERRYTLAPLN